MNLQYFYILFVGVLIFLVFQDPNVPRFIGLICQLAKINVIRFFMKIKMKRQLDKDYRDMQKSMKEWMKENGKDKM